MSLPVALALVCLVIASACGGRGRTPDRDGGPLRDGAVSLDGATSDGSPSGDGGGGVDGGRTDGGGIATMCHPTMGIECDGDWDGRCSPECAATECCSPRSGSFECVPRAADGSCPAADIFVDEERLQSTVAFEWRYFDAGDCAMMEGCISGTGWRRLMLFDTWTPNTGEADLYLGPPESAPEYFEYSSCHRHYHFNSYAQYALFDSSGARTAEGHKQAFCLLDYYQYPGTDGRGARYTCDNQGIQMGWQDVYDRTLDCQWVDVTDVPPGDYRLRVDVNFEGILAESDYTNNTSEVTVTIPTEATDVTVSCPGSATDGPNRDCGLSHEADYTCTPGATVSVGCAAACSRGSCTGDPFIRVCDPSVGLGCTAARAIAANDDHTCGGADCGGSGGGGCCANTSFDCPSTGEYAVFHASYYVDGTYTCAVATTP